MFYPVTYVSLIAAVVAALLAFYQILKKPPEKKPGWNLPETEKTLLAKQIRQSGALALFVFLLSLVALVFWPIPAFGEKTAATLLLASAFILFFCVLLWLARALFTKMLFRTGELQRENTSRLFRFFLYPGAFWGLVISAGIVSFHLAAIKLRMPQELCLLPIFAVSSALLWFRSSTALLARSADYGYELLRSQEALLPLAGEHNPLWRLRQLLSAGNRFLFYHQEYLALAGAALCVGYQISQKLAKDLALLLPFTMAIGAAAAIPALIVLRVKDKVSPETFLWNIRAGYLTALCVTTISFYLVVVVHHRWHIKYFWIVVLGGLTPFLLSLYSAIFVAENHRVARGLISAAASAVSVVVHRGLAAGMRGAAIPALIVAGTMALAYLLGTLDEQGEIRYWHGLFSVALALAAMLSLFPVLQAVSLVMPLSAYAIPRLRLAGRSEEELRKLEKFRVLRSVAMPSYALEAKVFYSALTILVVLVYSELSAQGAPAAFFGRLTETAAILLGGIAVFYLSARGSELVLNLGPRLVQETGRQFREIPGLVAQQAEPDVARLCSLGLLYLNRKLLPLLLGVVLLPLAVCLLGGGHGLTGYLIGFGFFSFLGATSWHTTGAALSSARHAGEADSEVSRRSMQLQALSQADMVGDALHEAVAPILALACLMTLLTALLFMRPVLTWHELLRHFVHSWV
ncbi:MAG: sodium/proton-translocating pyrophosphatase [Leptospiraceae bacterium]|nr:sodium/proton-translocating pyrophosphatase [Leptospiraceae bacterium]